jgi:hypothetical protein
LTHGGDIAVFLQAIAEIKSRYAEKVDVVIVGMVASIPKEIVDTGVIHIKPNPRSHLYPSYVRWLWGQGRFDIGCAPLADSPFNAAKSIVKITEFVRMGLVPLMSNVAPYKEVLEPVEPNLLVDNTSEEWIRVISNMIDNPEKRYEYAK